MTEEKPDSRLEDGKLVVNTAGKTEAYDAPLLFAGAMIFVAKGDGEISSVETQKMLELLGEHFGFASSESLALLTRVIEEMAHTLELPLIAREVGDQLTDQEKEDMALMMLKVVAADGHRDVKEMQAMSEAAAVVGISADIMHNAFDRYFDDK